MALLSDLMNWPCTEIWNSLMFIISVHRSELLYDTVSSVTSSSVVQYLVGECTKYMP